jgi:CxxC motif-containing protein (DUF1111 family)
MARKERPRLSLQSQRRIFGGSILAVALAVGYWQFLSDGLPVWWGPTASAAEKEAGRQLFEREWTANDPLAHGDGLGPVFNAKSCVFCHFQGGVGGGGEVGHNATHFEILPRPGIPEYKTGVLHDFAIASTDRETLKLLQLQHPTVKFPPPPPPPPPPPGHCGYSLNYTPPTPPPFDPVRTHDVQTTALFGIGWIDRISEKAIRANHRDRSAGIMLREMKLDFDHVPVGRIPITDDGRIGRFGWKGNVASLEDFVAGACANELGLGTPYSTQAKPIHKPDAADAPPDLDATQFRNLVAFTATLPRPVEVATAESEHGKQVFGKIGCAKCHVPNIGGVKGVYSDFLLYTLEDANASGQFDRYGPEPPAEFARPSHVPEPQQWKTPPLWGVADSAPYLHDGSAPTLAAAITAHRGEAKGVTAKYQKLATSDQQAVIRFLESLKAPPDAIPAPTKSTKSLKGQRLAQK